MKFEWDEGKATGNLSKHGVAFDEKKDELRPEYDLKNLKVRKVGADRQGFGTFVRLEKDVYQMFPNSESVNEALRFLMRITKENQSNALCEIELGKLSKSLYVNFVLLSQNEFKQMASHFCDNSSANSENSFR